MCCAEARVRFAVRSAVRNARARHGIRRAGCGAMLARGTRPGPSPASGVDTVGGFPAGCPGTISACGSVSGGTVVLAEHRTAPAAPALSTAVRTGERESSGKRVK